jgi:LPS-assembly lipoprotein
VNHRHPNHHHLLPMLTRRTWLGLLAIVPALPLLGGCGFRLRATPPMPFARIALSGFGARSPLEAELRSRLAGPVEVVDSPAQADVVLYALSDRRERSVVASTGAGQVRELQLRLGFEFRLTSPGGRELIPPTDLLLSRDMSYSETAALGKAQEEGELFAAMQADIVQQVLTRLSRTDLRAGAPARLPGAVAPPAAPASAPGR